MKTTGRIGWAGATAAALGVNAVVLALLSVEDRRALTPRSPAIKPVLYLDIEPRAPRPTDRTASTASSRFGGAPSPAQSPTSVPLLAPVEAETPKLFVPDSDGVEDRWRVGAGVGVRGDGLASCDAPHHLAAEARRRCDDRWTRLDHDVPSIGGTGDPERDAVFARQGARRLAAWENRRAAPTEADEPCVNMGPIVECSGVNVSVELFSTRDGILPNLRKRRE
ncbi:MAG: hypothetical protein ACT6R7_14035 [Brevundimonas aurantiaca]|uniref:hypothetical protein n=1 Tax=Brevundimonas aurantiaca TaxID=74316 RepID=UPI004033816D